jgi:uncharacterized protein
MTLTAQLGATPIAARALAPDLARGGMLLLIALANVHVYAFGHALGPRGYPRDLSVPDQVVVVAQLLLVDGRAYPLFAFLFGYGIVQLSRRRIGAGFSPAEARALVRRRGWWMILIGFVHGALLWPGDIIGAYGLIAVLFAGVLVQRSTRALVVMSVAGALLSALLYSGASLEMPDEAMLLPSMAEEHAGSAMVFRIFEWLALGFGFGFAMAFGAVAIGVLAGRHGVLDEPERFVPLLRGVAVGGLTTAVLLGLPMAMMAARIIEVPSIPVSLAFGFAHALGGYAGGLGYAALFGLLAIRLRHRTPGAVSGALLESGRRSMSSYLAQSVVFVALLPAWTLGLGGVLSVWQLSLIAVVAWVALVAGAGAMGKAGYRGPAEVLLRRLTYGATAGARR